MENFKSVMVSTSIQKILDFIMECPGREFTEKELQKASNVSKSAVNYAMKKLIKAGAVIKEKKGMMNFYLLNHKDPAVKQYKVLKNIVCINPFIKRLKGCSSKIILFGSASRGEDIAESDIDLFIVSHAVKSDIDKLKDKFGNKRKIQIIVRTELGYTELKHSDPIFYEQVQRGIVLWEKI